MQLANFQTLLLLLQVAICAADDTSALLTSAIPANLTTAGNLRRGIAPDVIGSTSVTAYESYTTWSCPSGSTWTTLHPFAGCRTTGMVQAPMYTGCANTSILLGPFDNDTCTGTGAQTTCLTGWIDYGHNMTLTNYECWPTWSQGNWKASRVDSTGLPLATVLAISVIVPIVVIAAVVAGLWWWRRRRRHQADEMHILEGRRASVTTTSTEATPSEYLAKNIEMDHVREGSEMEDQRRASEMSTTICVRTSTVDPLEAVDEHIDDASSYHTTDSRQVTHELYGYGAETGNSRDLEKAKEPNTLQKMLQRFRM